MQQAILNAEGITKRFGAVTAVDDVSLALGDGEILALLGPNGAGKTTLLRMLVGIFRPDTGRIAWHLTGESSSIMPRRKLGYLPEERGLYQDMPILRTLVYFGALHGMRRSEAERAALPWLERLSLADRADEPVKSLSKGNQQKVQFVAAVLHRPRLAILDEPFSGLDPLNQDLFVDLLRELRAAGTTVLFSAHQMALVERLADRVVLLGGGREVLQGTMSELRTRWRVGDRLVLVIDELDDATLLARHPAVAGIELDGAMGVQTRELRIRLRPDVPLGDLLRVIGEQLDVRSVRSEHVSLHEIYVRTVGSGEPVAVGELE